MDSDMMCACIYRGIKTTKTVNIHNFLKAILVERIFSNYLDTETTDIVTLYQPADLSILII